jgi:hypothetical protein
VQQRLGYKSGRPCGASQKQVLNYPTIEPDNISSWRGFVTHNILTNAQSNLQVHNMLIKAQEAGAHGCEDLAKAGACGRHPKNLARDMLRKLVRNVDFPKPYFAKSL